MKRPSPTLISKDKSKVRKAAIAVGRKVIWRGPDDKWHAATNRDNVPNWALESEDVA